MVVQLGCFEDKRRVLSSKTNPKSVRNEDGKKIFIDEQLPESMMEDKRRHQLALQGNRKKPGGQQKQVSYKEGMLHFDNIAYTEQVKTPSVKQILSSTKQQSDILGKANFSTSPEFKESGSSFQVFSANVSTLQEVRLAYTFLKKMNCT